MSEERRHKHMNKPDDDRLVSVVTERKISLGEVVKEGPLWQMAFQWQLLYDLIMQKI